MGAAIVTLSVITAAPAFALPRDEPRGPRESTTTRGGVSDPALLEAVAAATPTDVGTLVRTIDTSRFVPGSPDPSGIVYMPSRDRLQIVDSEVEETTGAGYHGVNLWNITRTGSVQDTGTTYPAFSKEPTGLGFDQSTNSLFISDDSAKRVWVDRPGGDGRWGTADDNVTSVNMGAYGSDDTEDPEFDPVTGHLFVLDGVSTTIFDIDPVDGVFGNSNDSMRTIDIGGFGPSDFEGLSSDASRGTLLVGARTTKQIFEITKTGTLVRIIDVSGVTGMRYISGLALAPPTTGSGAMNYWIVDRAVDNGANSSENDGKIFEIAVAGSTPVNTPPTVTNPGTKSNVVGNAVSFQIQASDPDGDAIASYGATGLPAGLSVNTSTGLVSGSVTTVGSSNVTISATDSKGATGSTSFTWNVTAVPNDPPNVTNPGPRSTEVGQSVTLQIQAVDPNGDAIANYGASGLPAGLSLDTATGLISGAPTTPGSSSVTISATDSKGATGSASFTWTITPVLGPIAFISSSTAKTNSSSSLTVARPSGVANGDVLIAAVTSTSDVTAPGGWQLLQRPTSGNVRLAVFWRSASSEPSSYTFSVGGKQVIAGTISAYRGATGVFTSTARANGSSTQIQANGVTTSADRSTLVGVFAIATNATIAPPNGMAERSEVATGGKLKVAVETADEVWPVAGPTGVRTATASIASTSIGILIALTPP